MARPPVCLNSGGMAPKSANGAGGLRQDPIRTISVVAPIRNEGSNVEHFVSDLAAQDFPGDVEVLVADGNSDDGSAERLRDAAWAAGLNLRVLDNPAGWVSHGLNACIREARGDLIVRLDCHSRYSGDYLRRCAELSERTGAWNVGGRLVPTGTTPMERAVACAMDSPFGGIGWTRAAGGGPVETDTVTFGAFRPEAFEHAGLFDETLGAQPGRRVQPAPAARRRADRARPRHHGDVPAAWIDRRGSGASTTSTGSGRSP